LIDTKGIRTNNKVRIYTVSPIPFNAAALQKVYFILTVKRTCISKRSPAGVIGRWFGFNTFANVYQHAPTRSTNESFQVDA